MSRGRLLALVGYGRWGTNIARHLGRLAPGRWAYLVEPCHHRRAAALNAHPGVAAADLEAVLSDSRVAAVLIATPARTHASLGLAALSAHKHVFVEKPLATSVKSALRLTLAAQAHGVVLMVGHIFRYVPAVRYIRAAVLAGELGDVRRIDCARLDWPAVDSDINAFWDLAPHDVSIANYVLGSDPQWVTATGLHLNGQLEAHHTFRAELRYAEGAAAHLYLSRRDPSKTRRITVVGTKSSLVYDDLGAVPVILSRYRGGRIEISRPLRRGRVEPLALELRHFLRCVDTGEPPDTDGWEGVRVVALLAAAEKSWRTGKARVPVTVPTAAVPIPGVKRW